MKGSLGTILNFLFAVKNEWPFGHSFQNFAFRCKKTNGRLGTTKKSVFRCKKVNGR